MARRYGSSYGGQFYDGPGALESLLANALEARKGAMDERRTRQIEADERALRAEDRQRRIAAEDRTRALEAQRLRDEGIVENPAEMGGGFARIPGAGLQEQERIRQDAKAVAEQERARTSAAIVGELFAAPPEQRAAIYQRLVQTDPAAARAVATELKPKEVTPKLKPWENAGFDNEQDWLATLRRQTSATTRATGGGSAPPKPKGPGLPTQAERTAAGLYEIGTNAIRTLETLEPPDQVQRFLGQAREKFSGEGENLKAAGLSFLQSSNTQQFYDASTELAMAAQYALSGKAVTREEGRKLAERIIPAPGEGANAVQQKLARRQEWIAAIKRMGGRAVAEAPRDEYDDEFDALDQRTP